LQRTITQIGLVFLFFWKKGTQGTKTESSWRGGCIGWQHVYRKLIEFVTFRVLFAIEPYANRVVVRLIENLLSS